MYYANDLLREKILQFKLKVIGEETGIDSRHIGKIVKENKPCMKLQAYALTKFIDNEKEINDFFIRRDTNNE